MKALRQRQEARERIRGSTNSRPGIACMGTLLNLPSPPSPSVFSDVNLGASTRISTSFWPNKLGKEGLERGNFLYKALARSPVRPFVLPSIPIYCAGAEAISVARNRLLTSSLSLFLLMQLTLNLRLPQFYDGRRNDGRGKSERSSAEGGRGGL